MLEKKDAGQERNRTKRDHYEKKGEKWNVVNDFFKETMHHLCSESIASGNNEQVISPSR